MRQAQRRIPQQADDSMTLIRGYSLNDAMLFIPGVFTILLTFVLVPPLFRLQGLLLGGVLILGSVIALATTPDHYKPTEWVKLHARHRLQQSEYDHLTAHYDHAQRTHEDAADQSFTQSVWAANQRTQDVLDIERVQPGTDARGDTGYVELTDGTLVGAVEIDPANLSLSTPTDWGRTVDQLGSTMNTLDFPTQIYRTSREFDVDHFLQPYRERQSDDDVQNEPVLNTLLSEFLTWYPQDLAERGTRVTEFYVIVPVRPEEVESSRRTSGFMDQLAEWPLLGRLISTNDEEAPETVLRGRQRETLYDRLASVRGHFREIIDIDASRVDAVEHAQLIAHAYHREDVDQADNLDTNGVTTRSQPTMEDPQ